MIPISVLMQVSTVGLVENQSERISPSLSHRSVEGPRQGVMLRMTEDWRVCLIDQPMLKINKCPISVEVDVSTMLKFVARTSP